MQYEERNIQLSQFLTGRADEIRNLTSVLESKYLNSNKFPHQILHKHLRRRAMSHNRYRIPASLRGQMNVPYLDELENQQKPVKCRKHIRKVKLLQCSYQRRARNIKWLETHLHQAKRMRMRDYFGYKVAYQANEKNWRAVHRFESHGCCVSDVSFYEIALVASQRELLEILVKEWSRKSILDQSFIDGTNQMESLIYNNDELIGPATFVFRRGQVDNLMIIFHPAMNTQIRELLVRSGLTHTIKQAEISIFQLYGPQQWSAIGQLIDLLSKQSSGPQVQYSNTKCVEYFDFLLDQIQKVQSTPNHEFKAVKTLADYANKPQISYRTVTQHNEPSSSTSKIWEFNVEVQDSLYSKRFKTLVRGRYTHRKKNKLLYQVMLKEKKKQLQIEAKLKQDADKERKKQGLPAPQPVEEEVRAPLAEDQGKRALRWLLLEQLKQTQEAQQIEEEQQFNQLVATKDTQKEVSLMIMPPCGHALSQFQLGAKIFVNLGQGNFIWRLLSQLKLKPVGLRDLRQLSCENRIPYFPDDFPGTQGYQTDTQLWASREIGTMMKTPPAKRINYFVNLFPCAFEPDWSLVEGSTRMAFLKAYKGVPKRNGIIVRPDEEDLQQLLKGVLKVPIKDIAQLLEPMKNDGRDEQSLRGYQQEIQKLKLDRQLIGFITYGNYSNKHSQGIATGHVSSAIKGFEVIVLTRNAGSKFYYFADCRLL